MDTHFVLKYVLQSSLACDAHSTNISFPVLVLLLVLPYSVCQMLYVVEWYTVDSHLFGVHLQT